VANKFTKTWGVEAYLSTKGQIVVIFRLFLRQERIHVGKNLQLGSSVTRGLISRQRGTSSSTAANWIQAHNRAQAPKHIDNEK